MTRLNVDAIITLVSAIPALLIASLSAWLAYLTLRRRNISRNDIETSAIEFIVSQTSTTLSSLEKTSSSEAPTTLSSSSKHFPQLQLPPVALLRDFEQ
ncbi:uncharacterized protein B0J16DRAFT_365876 [Fusarium flagelliforme]|uniref:uncharacterized protein n=1 Tax=Fusarium flagelliforme TaxID=2675880 RepID=UPI001E8EE340|nr:uncharacterized protein B0J16DRAFT_365876 [Fusarium flagelliforme]KAH7196571.1 hypothetical protein B0J16DRAFT_365876 [Fusarium flagelliforme]